MKKTWYFSHDYNARNDTKLQAVLCELGLEGVGAYWCIVEQLYEQGGTLRLDSIKTIAFSLHADVALVEKLIHDFDLFTDDGELFWSESVKCRMAKADDDFQRRSEAGKRAINARWKNKNAQNTSETNTNRIPIVYQPYTNRIATVYESYTNRIPIVYQSNTNRIRNEYDCLPIKENKINENKVKEKKTKKKNKEKDISAFSDENGGPDKNDDGSLTEKEDSLSEKPTKKEKVKKEKVSSSPLHAPCKEIFMNYYREIFGEEYYWEVKDSPALNRLIAKITNSRVAKGLPVDEDGIKDGLTALLKSINNRWLLGNFSMSIISSKYNEIVAQATTPNIEQPQQHFGGQTNGYNLTPAERQQQEAVKAMQYLATRENNDIDDRLW